MKFHKRGFTLIEVLVASMLLGMLMTILTMVFNSSAIAWRTGRAGNAKMGLARRELSYVQYLADNTLPRVDTESPDDTGVILGAWDQNGRLRKRAVEVRSNFPAFEKLPDWKSRESAGDSTPEPWARASNIQDLKNESGKSYVVGVLSWGPDGRQNTKDDICTLPFEVE